MEPLVDATRFELREALGAGVQGVVHRAHDRRRGVDVALKAIRRADALSILELKHEFRIASALWHPHLVRLYELFADARGCYFTMEWVDGAPLAAGLREAGAAVQRQRAGELAEAVHALHLAQRLHRDVKPANLLVAPGRGLVLLDFGFASTVRGGGDGLGTPAFAAPELLYGHPHTPASDWFAVGASLWEALAGAPIPRGPAGEPPPRRGCPAGVDPDLWALVEALLAAEPAGRPEGAAVLARLARALRPAELVPSPSDEPALLGRGAESAALGRLYAAARAGGGAAVAQVQGPSGIGKTALVQGFVAALPPGAVVLRGRCGPREDVPFNALDEVMDAAARALLERRARLRDFLAPPAAAALARVFPVFADLAGGDDPASLLPADAQEIRRLAAHGFVALVAGLSPEPPVVWLDDLHWSDPDSEQLLLLLLEEARDTALLFVLSTRTELPALRDVADREDLVLAPLAPAESLALARAWAGEDSPRVAAAARECQGSPLFLRQLVDRMAAGAAPAALPSLDAAIRSSLAGLPAPARDVLELLAVTGRPLALADAVGDARPAAGDPDPLFLLHDLRLLRGNAGARERAIEIDHDRIREVVLADLAPGRRRGLHLRVARTLVAQDARAEEIVRHFVEGGRPQEGAPLALAAADAAAAALAFNRAADLYGLLLSIPDAAVDADRRTLLAKRAGALAKAGRGEEAAAAYLEAAERAAGGEAIELRRQASEQLLRVGRVEDGMRVLGGVLRALRIPNPRGWPGMLGWLAALQLAQRVVPERALGPGAGAQALQRVDACFSAGLGLNMIDIRRSFLFQSVQLVLARRSGDARRLARALAVEGTYRATGSSAAGHRAAASLLARARTLASGIGDPEALAFVELCEGVKSTVSGAFEDAIEQLQAAASRYRAHQDGVTWEVASCELYTCWSLAYLGRLGALRERAARLQREAGARGDALAQVALAGGLCAIAGLAAGQPRETLARAREARARLPSGGFESLDYFDLVARTAVQLYEGDGAAAYAAVREAWPKLRRGLFLTLRFFRVELRFLRARAALAAALGATNADRRRLVADAQRQARRLARERFAFAQTLAHAIRAELLALGPPEPWRAALEALAGPASAGCPLLGRVARAALGDADALAGEVEDRAAFLRLWLPVSASAPGDAGQDARLPIGERVEVAFSRALQERQ